MYLFYDENNNVYLTYYVEPDIELLKTPHMEIDNLLREG